MSELHYPDADDEPVVCAVCEETCVEENYTQDGYQACSPFCAIHSRCEQCGTFVTGLCQFCGDPDEEP